MMTKEAIIQQIRATPEHCKRVKIEGKLGHKTSFAIALEKAIEKAK